MALQFTTVGIPFTSGLETKSDEKVVLPTKLTVLDNGEFTKRGTVRARPGHIAMQDATVRGTKVLGVASTAPVGTKLGHATRGDELLLLTDERIYSADESTSRWIAKGQHYPVTHTLEEIAQVNSTQTYGSVATAGGVRAAMWVDSRGGVRYSLYNADTGAAYVIDQATAGGTSTSRPTVLPMGENLVLLWVSHGSNEVVGRFIRTANLMASLVTAEVQFIGDLNVSRKYAVSTDGTDMYIAYHADGTVVAAGVGVAKLNAFGTTAWKTSVTGSTPTCLDVSFGTVVNVCWYDGGSVWRRTFNLTTGAPIQADFIIAAGNIVRVATGPSIGASRDFAYAWEITGATDDLHTVSITDIDNSLVVTQHAHLVSSGFQLKSDGRCMFILGHSSRTGLQGAYYLYTDESIVVGQLLYQTASARPASDHLTRVFGLETALGFKRKLDAEGTTAVFTHDGISRCTFDVAPIPHYAEAGGTAYLSGSALWAYDGQAVTEANLFMYPDMQTADLAESNTGTGALTAVNQYNYRVYYEVPRANGERVRSAALIVSKTLTGANDTITLTIPTLAHTRWRGDLNCDEVLGNASIVVYRSIGNDTTGIYYQITGSDPSVVTGDNRFVYNDPTNATVSFVDVKSDALLLGGAVDYLSRGELEHVSQPGPAQVCSVADRIFLAGGGIPRGTIRYSKLRFFGEPAHFSDTLVIDDLPEAPGDITSLSYINETLVALRETGISAVAGIGLDNTGSSGGYESQSVTTDVGCTGVSVVMPEGVMFTSTKGVYLLDQSYNVSYIGAAVERYNAQTFTGACVIPGTNQVLFVTSDTSDDARSIMFDYYFKEWAAWTIKADSLVVWKRTTPAFLQSSSGISLYRDISTYESALFTDSGSPYSFTLRTGPIRLSDCLQDFARLRKFQVLGTYRSAHQLLINLYYDRDTAPYETITWDPSTVIVTSSWGNESVDDEGVATPGTWGSSEFWGGTRDGANYQFEHKPMRQKFSTIRFEFSMIPGTTPGAGYELTELALQCGVKPGLQRHSAARKY